MEDILFLVGLVVIAQAAYMLVLWADNKALSKALQIERETVDILQRYLKPAQGRSNIIELRRRKAHQ